MKTATVKQQKKEMSLWAIIFIVIIAVYALSFVIPSGTYQREGTVAIPGTYEVVDKVYLTPWDVFSGVGDQAFNSFGKLFITILIIGGMMGVVNATKVIDRALSGLIFRLKEKALLIIPLFIFAMGFLGALGSMISTAILFIPLGLSIAQKLKSNRSFAVALIVMGSYTGFMTSPVNTLTTVLGQEIAGLDPYSGGGLRTVITVTNLVLVSGYLIWYARKTGKDPNWKEAWKAELETEGDLETVQAHKLTGREIVILLLFFGSFTFFAIGAPLFNFTTLILGSIMLPVGLVCGFVAGYDLDTTMKHMVQGAKDMVGVIMFMMLTCLMSVILNKAMILDTIVYFFSIPLGALGGGFAAIGMFVANALVNIFINSGSGQTAVMMPIMAPLSDVIGVTRQMAVLTLQMGDGFTNLLAPTSVNLLACLAYAKVSMKEWYKIAIPIHAIMFVVMCGFILFGTATGFS